MKTQGSLGLELLSKIKCADYYIARQFFSAASSKTPDYFLESEPDA